MRAHFIRLFVRFVFMASRRKQQKSNNIKCIYFLV